MANTVTVPVPTIGNKSQNALIWGFYIIIFIVIVAIAWKIYKTSQAAAKAAGGLLDQTAVSNATGIPMARITVIKGIAADAHKAIWGEKLPWYNLISHAVNGGWALTEDEDAFINALNRLVTASEVSYFCSEYQQIGGHSAKADLQYLSDSEKARIKKDVIINLY